MPIFLAMPLEIVDFLLEYENNFNYGIIKVK